MAIAIAIGKGKGKGEPEGREGRLCAFPPFLVPILSLTVSLGLSSLSG